MLNPGVGDSPPPGDPWTLTPAYLADRDAATVAELRTRYPGFAIGVGHSMGAMLTIIAQARHSCCAAHNHNIAPNRTVLWERLAGWGEGLP